MKKIIIFTSDGAGGHTATTNALTATLKDTYEIKPVNIFKDVIGKVDIINTLSFGKINGEMFYEKCLTRKYYNFLNGLHALGKWYFRIDQKKITRLVRSYLEKDPADLVISVVPLIDGAIEKATQQLNIPFLLIPTDLDSTNYIHDIFKPQHNNFLVTLPFEDADIRKKLEPARIPAELVSTAGFPIRTDFFEPKDISALRTTYEVHDDKPVIFLIMGSVGSDALQVFAQQLSKIDQPAHLIIGVGRYAAIKEKIKAIKFPPHISITVVDFIQKMSDVMAISDLMISKAGPVTMSEAMYMNLPMLVDLTASSLAWEKLNYQFMQKHQFGNVVTNINALPGMVNQLLSNKSTLKRMRENITAFEKKHGTYEVKKLIEAMI